MYLTKEKLEGAYAIAAIDKEDEQILYIARSKSPLLIGIGKRVFSGIRSFSNWTANK
jgi:glucosamine--fructose-6-phosphate aminotransferase (isomerizing)